MNFLFSCRIRIPKCGLLWYALGMNESAGTNAFAASVEGFQADYANLTAQVSRVIVGQERVVEQVLTCLFAGGHGLLEGVPGLGKTLLVRTLASALDLSFSRVQFTPDLMPADITGTTILTTDSAGGRGFSFQQGPIFANLVLADEINRATPKTQSAVLEAMQEATVSVSRETHALPQPFVVLATQNPIEMEGTYPLPEAQLDRFLLKIKLTSPDVSELATILQRTTGASSPTVETVLDATRVEALKSLVREVAAATPIVEYIAQLVDATHADSDAAPGPIREFVRYGASPRGAQAILLASKVAALRDGRAHVAFEDVVATAVPALRHRIGLNFQGQAQGVDLDELIETVLASIARP